MFDLVRMRGRFSPLFFVPFDKGNKLAKKISAIFANLDHYNPGMLSVELALHTLLERRGITADVSYFRPGAANPNAEKMLALPYRCEDALENQERILSSDAIVFWGDFQHAMPLKVPNRWPYKNQGAATKAEGYDMFYRMKFFEGLPADVRSRVILFGESLVTNVGTDYRDERYRRNLASLLKNARLAGLRDIHSAISATHCTGDYSRTNLCCDAALLLDEDAITGLPTTGKPEDSQLENQKGNVAVFLGRTHGLSDYLGAARFVRNYCKAVGLRPFWIPWLPRRNAYQEKVLYRPVGRRGWGRAVGDLLGSFRHFDMAITDTYHFSLNAWRAGIPAICIGRGAPGFTKEVDEKKKELFYRMYDGSELYVYREHLSSRRRTRVVVDRVREAVEKTKVHEVVLQNIRAHAAASEEAVFRALRDLLDVDETNISPPTAEHIEKSPTDLIHKMTSTD